MKPKQVLGSAALLTCLLVANIFAGEVQPSPSAPPPAAITVKKIHVPKAERITVPLTVFDLLSMVLSNLGLLQ